MKPVVALMLAALAAAGPATASAQVTDVTSVAESAARVPPSVAAVRVETPPSIDGRLDDAAWTGAVVISSFTQRDPDEGAPASESTEVRIVYDSVAIYVGARLLDRGAVTSRLGRRDMPMAASDWFRVSFDSFHDRLIGVRFDVNPSGVRRDAAIGAVGGRGGGGGGGGRGGGGGGGGQNALGGPDGDLAWDAVWDAAAAVDADGWTAELRIPFNQLRFSPAEEQTWGLQLERIIDRKQEHALFSFTPKSEPGGVPAFGDLQGLRGVRPGRPLELVPYLLSEADFADAGDNPFRGNREVLANAGLDARYRLTSNMILSATVNPDFGQVEVDPAIINLTAFETRYEERRPFFVEGASNFRFGGSVIGPAANAAALLYSRRIGRPPQLRIDADQVDVPGVTDILGAVKVSGRTAGGWSVGVLNAVTNEEYGRYLDVDGTTQRSVVEPGANYFTGRVNREFRRGMSTIGGMVTSMNRQLPKGDAIETLRSQAYSGGADFLHEWADRNWNVAGFFAGSHIVGSPTAIALTQRSSSRYFQRPDSRRLGVDPTATSMSGWAASTQLNKRSGLHWTGDFWVGAVSPGFEINDTGFLQRSDRIATGGALSYNERLPSRLLRSWSLRAIQNHTLNFDGDWIEKIIRYSGSVVFLNYWDLSVNGNWERERIDDRLTRGGPLASKPPSWTTSVGVGSDPRQPVVASLDVNVGGDTVGSWSRVVTADVSLRTSPRWNLSFGPQHTRLRQDAQYVGSVSDALMTDTFGARYVFATLEQTEVSLVTRLNYTFTPDLSLEVYLQPLVSNGVYGPPKEFRTPSAYDFATYGVDAGTIAKQGDQYVIDPDGPGPAAQFTMRDRSFTTRSLRGNAVLRWEYRPGSILYVVWQQERLNPALMDDFSVGSALGSLFEGESNNVFVLKWSYRFNP